MNARASLIFVSFMAGVSKKSGKDYQMLELSDGLKSNTFFLDLDTEQEKELNKLQRGDRVMVSFNVDLMDSNRPFKITEVSPE